MDVTRLSSAAARAAGGSRVEASRPTLKQVATLAGVSWKTVSRVVNDEPGVAEATAARVRQAADELGYRPNMAASNLRRSDRRTATIGLLLQDLSNPFSAALLRAVEDVARSRGVAVIAASLDEDEERERALVEEFVARRVDGLVLAPVAHDQSLPLAQREVGLPVVFVDRAPPRVSGAGESTAAGAVGAVPAEDDAVDPVGGLLRVEDVDVVVVDNVGGARDATRHLLDHGHRRIAFFGDRPTIPTAIDRREGYVEALRAHGLEVDDALVHLGPSSQEAGRGLTLAVLDAPDPPTAVLAAQNFLTMGAVRALAERGLQHQVALVGFDDFPLADLLDPPVTVVAQDVAAVGRRAAELLFARIDGAPVATHDLLPLPTRLVVRGSGEIRPPARPGRRSRRR